MIRELMFKWFGLESNPCTTCEVLKESLVIERQFNRILLDKLLVKEELKPPAEIRVEEQVPLKKFIPWKVKRQQLEEEDRKAAQILKLKQTEIADLEKELNIKEVK